MVIQGFFLLVATDKPKQTTLLPYFEGVADWKKLGLYLLPEKYQTRIEDIAATYNGNVAECRGALIREYLKVGELTWNKVIFAFENSGNPNIAKI